MQIPGTHLAASLAGINAKPTNDKTNPAESAPVNGQAPVEQSSESNPDRDAQGQGDGLARRQSNQPHSQQASDDTNPSVHHPAPNLPDEPPCQLDLLG